jgi:hypothetical protein
VTRPSRISRGVIVGQLRLAAKKGDRAALTIAVDQMKTWAYSPRYWQKYMQLLSHPLARLVDLTVIKQGDKIAHQKGWVKLPREPRKPKPKRGAERRATARRPHPAVATAQASLFPEL